MNINLRQLKKWIAALDSGEYKQTAAGVMQGHNSYCCLGVGCRVIIPRHDLILRHGAIVGGYPSAQPKAPKWLKNINDDFANKAGRRLSLLNDVDYLTFPEIATLLELVYVHKILD